MGTKTYSAGMSIDEVLANNAWVLEWTEQRGSGQMEFTYPGYELKGPLRQHTFEGLQEWANSVRRVNGDRREREKREEAEAQRIKAARESADKRSDADAGGPGGATHPVHDSLSEVEVSLEELLEEKRSAYEGRLSTINNVIASLTRERATLERDLRIVRDALNEYDHPQEVSGPDSPDHSQDQVGGGAGESGGIRAEGDARVEREGLGGTVGVSYSTTFQGESPQGLTYREVV